MLAACLSFGLLQIDGIERSFLGAPDREMLQTAFKLRDGVARGSGDPVLWLDIDYEALKDVALLQGANSPLVGNKLTGPMASVPRQAIASALSYARHPSATMVLLDVDIAWGTADEASESKLEAQLKAWAGDPQAPLLVLAREVLDIQGTPTLMATRFDAIVNNSPNIVFAGVNMLSGAGGIREFVADQCLGSNGLSASHLPSAVTYAMAAQTAYRGTQSSVLSSRARTIKAQVSGQTASILADCEAQRQGKTKLWLQQGLVSWHIGYNYPRTLKAAPVSKNWPHNNICQLSGPPLSAGRISVSDVMSAPKEASTAPLCRRLIIIGADNVITQDRAATPIGMLPGPIILANAMRGHFDTGPIMRQSWEVERSILQIVLLVVTVIGVVASFGWVSKVRLCLKQELNTPPTRWRIANQVGLFFTHPLCFKFVVAFTTFWFGALVTAFSLELGFWGLLSAPAYLATLFETWHQIDAERRSVVKQSLTLDANGE